MIKIKQCTGNRWYKENIGDEFKVVLEQVDEFYVDCGAGMNGIVLRKDIERVPEVRIPEEEASYIERELRQLKWLAYIDLVLVMVLCYFIFSTM